MTTSERLQVLRESEKKNQESIARFIANGQAVRTA